jgi:hypothetical protein
MPVTKKLLKLSEFSKGIILPKEWIEFQENKDGPFDEVIIEGLESDFITVRPSRSPKVEKDPEKVVT